MLKIIKRCFILLGLFVLIMGCSNENSPYKKEYKDFDETVEKFFIAKIISDYDTVKKYLPETVINESKELKQAPRGEILNPEYKDLIGEKYEITGFDFYYKQHKQIIYLIDYFDPKTKNPHRFSIYGVKKKGDSYMLMNFFDSKISGYNFKNETGHPYISISDLKDLMKKYPEHTYVVHSYQQD